MKNLIEKYGGKIPATRITPRKVRERMDGLVSMSDRSKFENAAKGIAKGLLEDGFEVEEVLGYLGNLVREFKYR